MPSFILLATGHND